MFNTLIQDLVENVVDDLTESLQVTVQHYAWIGVTAQGGPSYASPVNIKVILDEKERTYRMKNGQETVQRAKLIIPRAVTPNGTSGRHEPIDTRDKFVLPNGYTGPILWVEGVTNPSTNRRYVTEVILG